jgi:sigma-B regulation protein RsbU (phosphoserine phosphatase)
MIEPKQFYKELDSILSKINKQESGESFFPAILAELEQKFGSTLGISRSHVFEQRGDEFVLIHSSNANKGFSVFKTISSEAEAVQHVLKHGSYIYDNSQLIQQFGQPTGNRYRIPAAISISSPDVQWLFVFELKDDWNREEITLFLNALRTALNYRLYTERINTELERVAQIQRSLLPRSAPKLKGYQIAERSLPAAIVGGDFYEYFLTDDGTFILSIGDASGHGLPAALMVRDVVIGLRIGLSLEMRLVHTLKKLNQVIQGAIYSTNFISLFIGEIEEDGHLVYVNAGHPPPFVVSGDEIADLEATGIALGFLENLNIHQAYVQLEPESLLVLYSDGIIERKNEQDEQFGIKRLKALVAENKNYSPKEIINLVFEKVFDFGNHEGWEDDASLVIVRRIGPCKPGDIPPASLKKGETG